MKKSLVVICILTLALAACEKEGTVTSAAPVTAKIENPDNGDSLVVNIPIKIQMSATSYTGINEFQLWIDGVQVLSSIPGLTGPGMDGSTTFWEEFVWSPTQPGSHTIRFVAIEGSGQNSDEVEVEVEVVIELPADEDDSSKILPSPTPQRKQPTNTPVRIIPPPTSTPGRKTLPTPTPTPGRG